MILTVVQKYIEGGLISNEQEVYILWMFAILFVVVAFFGVLSNTVNIQAFVSMGVNDGVTVSFLILSVSDLVFVLSNISMGILTAFWALEMDTHYHTWFTVDPFGAYILSANVSFLLYVMTMLTTMFLAIARSMCVAKPLHFKNAFTKNRSLFIHLAFAIFTVFSYLPVLLNMGMSTTFDARVNSNRTLLWITSSRQTIKDIVWTMRDTFLSLASQFILIICVGIMVVSLRKSSAFRQKSVMITSDGTDPRNKSGRSREGQTSSSLSGKDLQVVQQVTLVSILYIVCNMPKILVNLAQVSEPELTIGKRYQNVSHNIINTMTISQLLNCSLNFLVYYKFNSKFRSVVSSFWCS
ncbi:uncharacterized protein LOC131946948 [Physella acuta]|uniref:uncharacterized protein LOC131946948 n=1 Tax=Physella acuta TaxID=109671 RepID=UPI0027DDDED6|nr:uncharacterized protein LOC131946948 [Physella acuta]